MGQIINKESLGYYERILMENYFDRVSSILNEENPPPVEIELQMSAECNANCNHCFGRGYTKPENKFKDKENITKVIDEILNFKRNGFEIQKVKFCGTTGEPLMNYNTLYAIDRFYNEKEIILFTNGIKLAEHKDDWSYLSTISKASRINLSLDAGSTETMHKIKPGSRHVLLEEILGANRKIKEICKKENKKTNIDISYVITNDNYFEILDFVKKTKGLADRLKFRIDLTDRSVSHNHGEEIIDLLKEAKKYETEKFKIEPVHSEQDISQEDQAHFSSKGSGLKCYLCKLWTCIGADANVYPCGHIVGPEIENCGNVLENSLEDIWGSKTRKNCIEKLPAEKCTCCSPFSLTVNKVVTSLSKSSKEQVQELHEIYA